MSLGRAVERLARAKGWHANQYAHCNPDCWTIGPNEAGDLQLWPPDPRGCFAVSDLDAALWILLAAANFHALVIGGRSKTPAELVIEAVPGPTPEAKHIERERAARDALDSFSGQLRDEALVLADRWMAEGIGLSTRRAPFADGPRCRKCPDSVRWFHISLDGTGKGYCDEHRPMDGWGDRLAASIAAGVPVEAPSDITPGRDHGDGYSPTLWMLIREWLAPNRYDAGLRDDLVRAVNAAWVRATAPCPECFRTPGRIRGAWACPKCRGERRIPKEPANAD